MAIYDFISMKDEIGISNLSNALNVLLKFKECESAKEFMVVPFSDWWMFEVFEDFLEYMVNGKPLDSKYEFLKSLSEQLKNKQNEEEKEVK